jgi:hypothetical protein
VSIGKLTNSWLGTYARARDVSRPTLGSLVRVIDGD